MEIKPSNVIAYGTQPRRSRRFMVSVFACLLAAASVMYWKGEAIFRWWRMVQIRHQVLVCSIPQDTVLARVGPSDTRQSLLKSLWAQPPLNLPARQGMRGLITPTPTSDNGFPWVVLLHERWTPSGKHRLVLVEASATLIPDATHVNLALRMFDPGSFLHPTFTPLQSAPPKDMKLAGVMSGLEVVLPRLATVPYGSSFELLSGRPDPNDASAFLFDVRLEKRTITIKGRIADDDSFSLSAADGSPLPLTANPASNVSN